MRLLIIIVMAAATLGCRTTDSSSRREIALLRTEILDLEDQYYLLKSRCAADGVAVEGNDLGYSGYAEGAVVSHGETYIDGYPDQYHSVGPVHSNCNCPECGRVIYDAPSQHIQWEQPLGSELYYPEASLAEPTPQPILTEGEEVPGREIVDPLGQPFDEAPAGSVLPESSQHISPRRHNQHSNERARESRTATQGFKPDPRFSDLSVNPSLEIEPNRRSSEGWVQNQRPRRNNVDFEQQAGTVGDEWGRARVQERGFDRSLTRNQLDSASSTRWQQASTQRRIANNRQDSYSLSSQPLDDRYLPNRELDAISDLSEQTERGRIESRSVSQIFIDPEYTYGRDFNNDGEQDGISILIQPLDEQGNVVATAADLVVSLIDPAEIGEKQRIGLWKYESYQAESFVSNQRGRRGLVLELPWQRRVPANDRLLVFVRYTTPRGERLETSFDVRVDPPNTGYDSGIGDNVANRSDREFRSIPTTAGNPIEVPKWRPVR